MGLFISQLFEDTLHVDKTHVWVKLQTWRMRYSMSSLVHDFSELDKIFRLEKKYTKNMNVSDDLWLVFFLRISYGKVLVKVWNSNLICWQVS